MIKGTPLGGRSEIAKRYLIDGPNVQLVLYTNTRDSLGDSTIVSSLTQPTASNGYAPITLLNTGWSEVNGALTYIHPAGPDADELGNPGWIPTGSWSAPVTGEALIYGTRVLHYQDRTNPIDYVAVAGLRYAVSLADLIGP